MCVSAVGIDIKPYSILGYYKPSKWSAWRVGRDITRITRDAGLKPLQHADSRYAKAPWSDPTLHAHVRRRTLRSSDGAGWHQDGDYGHVPMDHGLVFWSSNSPTEFKVDGVVYQPRPYEVVYFRNLSCYHRRPIDAPRVRWFFRQRVQ